MKIARTYTIEASIVKALQEEKEKTGVPQSTIIEKALKEYFKK